MSLLSISRSRCSSSVIGVVPLRRRIAQRGNYHMTVVEDHLLGMWKESWISHDLNMDGEPHPLSELEQELEHEARHGPRGLLAAHAQNAKIRELAARVLRDHEERLSRLEGGDEQ